MDKNCVAQRLSRTVSKHWNTSVRLGDLQMLTGGSASQTWRFSLLQGKDTTQYILRMAQPGEPLALGINKTLEAAVQSHAVVHGVVAPRVVLVLEAADQLGEGFVMEYVAGETIPQKILRKEEFHSARQKMAAQCGRLLADIHAAPLEALEALALPNLSAAALVERFESIYHELDEVIPVFDYAFHYLRAHIPPCEKAVLVHGDFRNGNFIVDKTGIVSVLDWELAHLGDPMEDLGWLCVNSWRFGNNDRPVGGFGSRLELYESYHRATGRTVDVAAVRFWELFGVLKWGVICLLQTRVHLSGEERSVNRAAIGRRVSETELDLLAILASSTNNKEA